MTLTDKLLKTNLLRRRGAPTSLAPWLGVKLRSNLEHLEMEPSLGELFRRSRGAPIEYRGRRVQAIFEHPLESEDIIHIQLQSLRERPQGVCIKIVIGTLLVNAQRLNETVLWTDTAPASVRLVCQPKGKAVLKIWNTWKDEQGVQHAWIGNSGMLVETSPERVRFRCSDGIGDVDFNDLTVLLTFESRASTDSLRRDK
jgi:hypothetical protein